MLRFDLSNTMNSCRPFSFCLLFLFLLVLCCTVQCSFVSEKMLHICIGCLNIGLLYASFLKWKKKHCYKCITLDISFSFFKFQPHLFLYYVNFKCFCQNPISFYCILLFLLYSSVFCHGRVVVHYKKALD